GALDQVARHGDDDFTSVRALYEGKFGALFATIAETGFLNSPHHWQQYYRAASDAIPINEGEELSDELAASLRESLQSNDRAEKLQAALRCKNLAFLLSPHYVHPFAHNVDTETRTVLGRRFKALRDLLGVLVD